MSKLVNIEGIQQAQQANLRALAVMQPEGKLGQAIQLILPELHRFAVSITHVWKVRGGALRASHRMSLVEKNADTVRGSIFIDPSAVNPRGQRPAEYGVYENARGGEHAFYARTALEAGPRAQGRAAQFLTGELDGH